MSEVTLLHGDCLDLVPKLSARSAQLIFCDLPYATKSKQVTANAWDVAFDLTSLWTIIRHVRANNAPAIFTCKAHLMAALLQANPTEFRYDLIWDKVRPSRHLHAKRMPLLRHEQLLVFYKDTAKYNPQMELRDKPKKLGKTGVMSANARTPNYASLPANRVYSHRFPTSIVAYARENFTVHPTQKPVALLEWLIKTYTNPGDTVLDPVMGSGTTGVACINTGRKFIGIEKDRTYFELAEKRIADAVGQSRAAI